MAIGGGRELEEFKEEEMLECDAEPPEESDGRDRATFFHWLNLTHIKFKIQFIEVPTWNCLLIQSFLTSGTNLKIKLS